MISFGKQQPQQHPLEAFFAACAQPAPPPRPEPSAAMRRLATEMTHLFFAMLEAGMPMDVAFRQLSTQVYQGLAEMRCGQYPNAAG